MVWEIANLETQLGGRNLASQLAVRGLLRIGEEGLKDFEIGGIRDGGGLQD